MLPKSKKQTRSIKETELDAHSRWVLDGGMNTIMGEGVPDYEEPDTIGPATLDKKSMSLVDKCIEEISNCKTAAERQQVLQNYAAAHHVSEQDLMDHITQYTGTDYFSRDDEKVKFSENKLIESFIKTLKKIR